MPVSAYLPRLDYYQFNSASGAFANGAGGAFADVVEAAIFPKHIERFWNQRWALRLGLGALTGAERVAHFGQFQPFLGAQPQPLAMRYHGHQFGHYNPNLGDGRGFLYAQCEDPVDHRLLDFGTKGSGTTPYSRAGDGRLTLKGAVREALATEYLEAQGVYTSKTFCFFETGEALERNDEPSPTRAAVLTRLSHGHIRYGTFQRLATHGLETEMRALVDYSVKSYFTDLKLIEGEARTVEFFKAVVERAAVLTASWMVAGFVHGVLNTDNMNITGESFDYGPWRFLPTYDPSFTAAYFDHQSLYCYGRQPHSVHWNLAQLLESLSLIAPRDQMESALREFPRLFEEAMMERFFAKLGLQPKSDIAANENLFVSAFNAMGETKVGFEQFFFDWYGGPLSRGLQKGLSLAGSDFVLQLSTFRPNAQAESIDKTYFAREAPETILIDEVEAIWSAIDQRDDWTLFNHKIESMRERGRIFGHEPRVDSK